MERIYDDWYDDELYDDGECCDCESGCYSGNEWDDDDDYYDDDDDWDDYGWD